MDSLDGIGSTGKGSHSDNEELEIASIERGAIRAIAHYLEQTHGKAFVLFTSYKMLEAASRQNMQQDRSAVLDCSSI